MGDTWYSLPEHFKANGYLTTGLGKLFHPGVPPNFDQPRSWSSQAPDGSAWPYKDSGTVNGTNACARKCCREGGNSTYTPSQFCLIDVKPGTFLLDQTVKNVSGWSSSCRAYGGAQRRIPRAQSGAQLRRCRFILIVYGG